MMLPHITKNLFELFPYYSMMLFFILFIHIFGRCLEWSEREMKEPKYNV